MQNHELIYGDNYQESLLEEERLESASQTSRIARTESRMIEKIDPDL